MERKISSIIYGLDKRANTLGICIFAISSIILLGGVNSVYATHVPLEIDTPVLWSAPVGIIDGYLEFINPTEHPGLIGIPVPFTPPGVINTEEFTGYTLADGTDVIEVGDGDITHGDKADFDWVQQNRVSEFAGLGNHPGLVGAMGWTPGTPEMSPHVDPGTGGPHGHSVVEGGTLPELINTACVGEFNFVDVFSIISEEQDTDPTPREAALDYELAFGHSITGASSPGIPTVVFVPGWTTVTGIDDYVARWVPATPGLYDLVAIEPSFAHDGVTEIDAIKCFRDVSVGGTFVPIDQSALLLAGVQSVSMWMIPVILAGAGIGVFVIKRRN